ncbi:hypothetical protein [Cyanobium sp. N5-Cardenillas]|uniref:hypothetical protein n=1 Tax=Cyanobium sp. N5-Cardenillas TaxID=2823720 RepID=UPI0020CC8BE7|nr:hypothetical protein [Cyanobium sp. N5-Cardenillas]MCP9785045.1 hypothetical protein [Cyanobium sp. N5-Cardenillas]
MSYLRQIMQRLHDRSTPLPTAERGEAPGRLEEHLALYGARLQACSDAMLQYEAAWLDQHIETLELCGSQPTMQASAGGAERVQALLQESLCFRQRLESCRRQRGLEGHGVRAAVVASEHAWELTDPALRRAWGFPAEPPAGPAA